MESDFSRQTQGGAGAFSNEAWLDVLKAVDRTYADLVSYQERLEAQNGELEELRLFLASVLSSVSDVLIVISRAGTVQEVSASARARSGRTRDALVGAPVGDLFAQSDRAALAEAMARAAHLRSAVTLEAALLTPDGPSPLELNLSPRFDDRGRSAGMVLVGRPVGELRQANAALEVSLANLKEAQAMLVRGEKLAALGRLVAGVAHELNNPISFVYANTHALERYAAKFETYFAAVQAGASRDELIRLRAELKLDREVGNLRTAIDGARDGAARVRDIVEDLRRLSSDGSGEMLGFDLVDCTKVAASWVIRGAKAAARVEFTGLGAVRAHGRPGHVQQVVMNLVQNAADAVEGVRDPVISFHHAAEAGMAVLEVRDNGPGVPEAARAAIFDPFFTTKTVGKGTGLGLSISHKIAQEHGGSLSLVPSPRGACFRLELPLGAPA